MYAFDIWCMLKEMAVFFNFETPLASMVHDCNVFRYHSGGVKILKLNKFLSYGE
jgi:hypothetical protein